MEIINEKLRILQLFSNENNLVISKKQQNFLGGDVVRYNLKIDFNQFNLQYLLSNRRSYTISSTNNIFVFNAILTPSRANVKNFKIIKKTFSLNCRKKIITKGKIDSRCLNLVYDLFINTSGKITGFETENFILIELKNIDINKLKLISEFGKCYFI